MAPAGDLQNALVPRVHEIVLADEGHVVVRDMRTCMLPGICRITLLHECRCSCAVVVGVDHAFSRFAHHDDGQSLCDPGTVGPPHGQHLPLIVLLTHFDSEELTGPLAQWDLVRVVQKVQHEDTRRLQRRSVVADLSWIGQM